MEDNYSARQKIDEYINEDPDFINKPINKVKIIKLKMLDTLMHYYAYKNNSFMINYLISKNADLNLKNAVNIN